MPSVIMHVTIKASESLHTRSSCIFAVAAPGKDVKKLRGDVAAACPLLSEAAVDDLVPPKATVSLQKLQNRATVPTFRGSAAQIPPSLMCSASRITGHCT